jgi:hypothetical protein
MICKICKKSCEGWQSNGRGGYTPGVLLQIHEKCLFPPHGIEPVMRRCAACHELRIMWPSSMRCDECRKRMRTCARCGGKKGAYTATNLCKRCYRKSKKNLTLPAGGV